MTFQEFSQVLQKLELTPSRLAMTEQLSQLYQKLEGEEIKLASYLMQGKLVPKYESLEFNLSVKMMIKVLARLNQPSNQTEARGANLFGEENYSQKESQVSDLYKKLGDLGLVAEQVAGKRETSHKQRLSITQVYHRLSKIAQDGGAGSQQRKVQALVDLLDLLDPLSAKFAVRVVIGKVRLGFSTMTIIDALSWAVTGSKAESKILEVSYDHRADVGQLAIDYLKLKSQSYEKRADRLSQTKVEVGTPVMPALCQRLNTAQEIIDKMGEVIVEPKYDGLRLQLHIDKTDSNQPPIFKAFTRNLEESSHMFPELQDISYKIKCKSVVLDGEVIGFKKDTGQLVPFQETITRKRKHLVGETAAELPIRYYVFDVLSLNGKSLLTTKLRARKDALKNLFSNNDHLHHTEYITTKQVNVLRKYHQDQLGNGLEGAVIKQIDSFYVSGRKGWNWVKIKEAIVGKGKLSDTLDCIVMGYYKGRGKRSEFGLGALLVGLVSADQIVTIAKIGTGLTDEMLKEMKRRLDNLQVDKKPTNYSVHKNLKPDVWTSPQLVIEVAADEITKSPVHSAGVALRFPRLIKIRDDKSPAQATTSTELKGIQVA